MAIVKGHTYACHNLVKYVFPGKSGQLACYFCFHCLYHILHPCQHAAVAEGCTIGCSSGHSLHLGQTFGEVAHRCAGNAILPLAANVLSLIYRQQDPAARRIFQSIQPIYQRQQLQLSNWM